jgi:Protein of unknown function (DUF1302)
VNRTKLTHIFTVVGMSFIILVPGTALAIDWNFTGFVRQEIAVSITNVKNPYNASTKPNIDKSIPVQTFGQFVPGVNELGIFSVSPTTCTSWAGANSFGFAADPAGSAANAAAIAATGVNPQCGPAGVSQSGSAGIAEDASFNMFNTRAEFDIQANNITKDINAFMKLRVYFDGTKNFNDQTENGPIFKEQFYGNRGNLLEVNSNSFLVDIPSLYFDYNKGPLWVRVGQQQIAWGEALFFRVFDVANGLDLRRHFFLDVAAEEYADERVASPGVRISYTFGNGIELDGFVQMFSPTLLPGQGGPYNLVTNGFKWDNRMELDEAKNTLNYGMRAIWPITDSLTIQAMAVNRRNPDGVTRWHDAPATMPNGTPNPFCSGTTMANTVSFLGQNSFAPGVPSGLDFSALFGSPFGGTMGLSAADIAALETPTGGLTRTKYTENGCGSFFMPDPLGTQSAATWWQLSAEARVDPTALVEASVDLTQISSIETRKGFGLPSETGAAALARFGSERAAGVNTLDAFQTGFGPLAGWITREWKRESIFGFGGNYIFNMEDQLSFFNQLVLRGEMSYTPNKKFTNTRLSADWIEADEWTASIVAEKWHRWTDKIPAIFMVAEWMFKSESDLFGRHLSLMGTNPSTDLTCGAKCSNNRTKGQDSFNAVVFAFQQPFPDLVWRLDFALMVDIQGGWFIQPGVRYRPSAHFQFDIYANIAQDGGGKGDDIIETFQYNDEVFVRATYFF